MSLVYSFDVSDVDSSKSELSILGVVSSKDPLILYKHSSKLKDRDLVQARGKFRAVLPHAVANRLAKDALDSIPISKIKYLLSKGSKRLIASFTKRLSFLADSPVAIEIAENLFLNGGLAGDISQLDDFKMSVFENVAIISPQKALCVIRNAIDISGEKFLSRENNYRRKIVGLLRQFAYDKKSFRESVDLILGFILYESTDDVLDGNTDSDALKSLFFLYMSGTHADISDRLSVINKLWISKAATEQNLSLELLSNCLTTSGFMSHYSTSLGSNSRDFGYSPTTYEDVEQWYAQSALLCLEFAGSSHFLAEKAGTLLAQNIRALWDEMELYDLVEEICKDMSRRGYWSKGWIAIRETIVYGQNKGLVRLNSLSHMLMPKILTDKIRTFTLGEDSGNFSFISGVENLVNQDVKFQQYIRKLGVRLGQDKSSLTDISSELVLSGNEHSWYLGVGIYEGSANKERVWTQIETHLFADKQTEYNISVLMGMLHSMSIGSPELAENKLDQIFESEALKSYYIRFQRAIPISNRAIVRINKLLDGELIPVIQYRNLHIDFTHPGISDAAFVEIIKKIAGKEKGLRIAIDLFSKRFWGGFDSDAFSKEVLDTGRALLSDINFDLEEFRDDRVDYQLAGIAKICLSGPQGLSCCKVVAANLLRSFRHHVYYPTKLNKLLQVLITAHPSCILDFVLFRELSDTYGKVGIFELNLERGENLLNQIEERVLFVWCDQDSSKRYPLLSKCLLFYRLNRSTGKIEWTNLFWDFLKRAPDTDAFLENIESTFHPTMVSGSRSEILRSRLSLFQSVFDHENKRLAAWVKKMYSIIDTEFKNAHVFEEHRNREVLETFE